MCTMYPSMYLIHHCLEIENTLCLYQSWITMLLHWVSDDLSFPSNFVFYSFQLCHSGGITVNTVIEKSTSQHYAYMQPELLCLLVMHQMMHTSFVQLWSSVPALIESLQVGKKFIRFWLNLKPCAVHQAKLELFQSLLQLSFWKRKWAGRKYKLFIIQSSKIIYNEQNNNKKLQIFFFWYVPEH